MQIIILSVIIKEREMEIYKHKIFHEWANKESLKDNSLKEAIDEMSNGLFEANLGGGLYKKRIAASGRGKRSGHRALLAFKSEYRAVFIYGFAKNERENISRNEEKIFKQLAKDFLSMDDAEISYMMKNGKLFKVK